MVKQVVMEESGNKCKYKLFGIGFFLYFMKINYEMTVLTPFFSPIYFAVSFDFCNYEITTSINNTQRRISQHIWQPNKLFQRIFKSTPTQLIVTQQIL